MAQCMSLVKALPGYRVSSTFMRPEGKACPCPFGHQILSPTPCATHSKTCETAHSSLVQDRLLSDVNELNYAIKRSLAKLKEWGASLMSGEIPSL